MESKGALVIFLYGYISLDRSLLPMLVCKLDSGFNYATTNLVVIWYWVQLDPSEGKGGRQQGTTYVTDTG